MLKTRVMTAAVLLAGFVSALFLLPQNGWIAFCAVFLGLSAWEWGALMALAAVGRSIYSIFLVGLFVLPGILETSVTNGRYAPAWVYYVAGSFWIVLVPLWIGWRQRIDGRALLLAVGAIVLVPAFAAMVDLRSIHPSLLIAVLGTVWVSDTAAYFAGRRLGRRKLAPSISPGKTWEGVAGALAAVGIYALAWAGLGAPGHTSAWPAAMRVAVTWILPVLLGLAVVGMIGDLFESLIKRQAGVKDSGTLLPGHGGILDRIDASVAMLPLAVLAFMR
ncbi:MAG: phosphatidate cytidylyltransferase [Betaproteobacteria bacterium]|nr:MAG: phosphatidate cytidylyltransferase [Betaproteobacteria bacterium]TMH91152.1 MAG: phosphatidate cytidylyltransferase [Betaproteobacteria bacterium]